MKFQFLSKTNNNKRFRYTPMYYDERKERLELKKKEYEKIEREDLDDQSRRSILRNNLQASWSRQKHAQSQKRTSNMRVLLLIAILLLLGYVVFNGVDEVDTVVKKLW